MVNYKIQKSENGMHDVVETQTGYSIVRDLDAGQAKASCRHLNFGGGFDGWTPVFFLAKTKFSYNESTFLV